MTDNQIRQDIITLLEQELGSHREMLALLEKERIALTYKKPADIIAVTEQKDALLENISQLEAQRNKLVVRIAADEGVKWSDVTLSFLFQQWSNPELIRLQGEFILLMDKIAQAQKLNLMLIYQGQEMTNLCISALTYHPGQSFYGKEGNIKDQGQSYNQLDNHV